MDKPVEMSKDHERALYILCATNRWGIDVETMQTKDRHRFFITIMERYEFMGSDPDESVAREQAFRRALTWFGKDMAKLKSQIKE